MRIAHIVLPAAAGAALVLAGCGAGGYHPAASHSTTRVTAPSGNFFTDPDGGTCGATTVTNGYCPGDLPSTAPTTAGDSASVALCHLVNLQYQVEQGIGVAPGDTLTASIAGMDVISAALSASAAAPALVTVVSTWAQAETEAIDDGTAPDMSNPLLPSVTELCAAYGVTVPGGATS